MESLQSTRFRASEGPLLGSVAIATCIVGGSGMQLGPASFAAGAQASLDNSLGSAALAE